MGAAAGGKPQQLFGPRFRKFTLSGEGLLTRGLNAPRLRDTDLEYIALRGLDDSYLDPPWER